MKNYFIFLFFSLSSLVSSSQNLVGKSFVTNVENIRVYPVDSPANDGRHFYYVHRNTKFTVVGIDKTNNLIITFWKYKKKDTITNKDGIRKINSLPKSADSYSILEVNQSHLAKGGPKERYFDDKIQFNDDDPSDDYEYIGPWAGTRSFIMPLASFNQQAQAYYGKQRGFSWGVMTLPIKIRFGNAGDRFFNFEEKINLGFSAGIKQQIQSRTEQSINYLGGFGVVSAKTDSVSLKPGFYDSKHLSEIAFSFNLGVLYQYESFQIGIFAGKDYLASTLGRQWRYQGKTWIGLAIGISLFSKPSSNTSTGKN